MMNNNHFNHTKTAASEKNFNGKLEYVSTTENKETSKEEILHENNDMDRKQLVYASLMDRTCYGRLLALDNYINLVENMIEENNVNDLATMDQADELKCQENTSLEFDFSKVGILRNSIQNILKTPNDSIQPNKTIDESYDVNELVQLYKEYYGKNHHLKKNTIQQNDNLFRNFSTGILNNNDTYDESQLLEYYYSKKQPKSRKRTIDNHFINPTTPATFLTPNTKIIANTNLLTSKEKNNDIDILPEIGRKRRKRPFLDSEGSLLLHSNIENNRFRYYCDIITKGIPKAYRLKNSSRIVFINNKRKLGNNFSKYLRRALVRSRKLEHDFVSRSKKLFKDALNANKKNKTTRSTKKKKEIELDEQEKQQKYIEIKRQQRKLNYLITQTELYSHFMGLRSQSGNLSDETNSKELMRILSTLDEPDSIKPKTNSSTLIGNGDPKNTATNNELNDDYDVNKAKTEVVDSILKATEMQNFRLKQFQITPQNGYESTNNKDSDPNIISTNEYFSKKERIFIGDLKCYQLSGVSWLCNLYDKGLNGILADEMGLGKTVQTISFFAYLAEIRNIWGPFLVVAPSSTLHNWQQELSKFVPEFKALPYWGSANDRKLLRAYWNLKKEGIQSRYDAPFHVLITSYQLILVDRNFFKTTNWQYLVLDEAQAIKSSTSQRWQTLLEFNCRNRLLITGTPMQNNMSELWALLHFIMPAIFDSHEEFNEWFSKDIEGRVENKATVDDIQLTRLHMVIKPFVMRRTKKEVEKELTDKIEIILKCHLSVRQNMLYEIIKEKVSNEDVLLQLEKKHCTLTDSANKTKVLSSINQLMNLMVQLRKICDHPDLIESRGLYSPIFIPSFNISLPNSFIIGEFLENKSKKVSQLFNIYSPENVTQQLFESNSNYGGIYFSRIHPATLEKCMSHIYGQMECIIEELISYESLFLKNELFIIPTNNDDSKIVKPSCAPSLLANLTWWPYFKLSAIQLLSQYSQILNQLVFLNNLRNFNRFGSCKIQSIAKTPIFSESILKQCNNLTNSSSLDSDMNNSNANGMVKATMAASLVLETINTTNCDSNIVLRETPLSYPDIILNAYLKKVICPAPHIKLLSKRAFIVEKNLKDKNKAYEEYVMTGFSKELCEQQPKYMHLNHWSYNPKRGFNAIEPFQGWNNIILPHPSQLIVDSGKMVVLHSLLSRLKAEGHRVLIYSQMTKMIDILENYIIHCKYKYVRLDGSSKMNDRRETVDDFQNNSNIFIFLLSTRAGGVGINLTAADTVIFYDSDWNPTVDQQAMDRAHRLGQTRQVIVYRLVCEQTIEERILQRADQKAIVQKMIISGKTRKDTLKPRQLMEILLGEEELKQRLKSRKESAAERRKNKKKNLTANDPSPKKISKTTTKKATKRKRTISTNLKPNLTTDGSINPALAPEDNNNPNFEIESQLIPTKNVKYED